MYRSDTVPNGEHIYRFVDTISRTIRPRYRDKYAPSVKTVKDGLRHLTRVLTELHPTFTISKSEAIKLDSLFNKLVKDKVLIAGK
jgi:hypothetical protein